MKIVDLKNYLPSTRSSIRVIVSYTKNKEKQKTLWVLKLNPQSRNHKFGDEEQCEIPFLQ